MTYRVLSLFAGIGGFDLGLERTGGFKTVAFCEIDPFCRRVLAKHWPGVPCYHDVRELTGARLKADGIDPDCIVGGFPCQDVSNAGKGAGLAGERSGLWREFARLIGELRPRFIIVENVAALLDRGLSEVLGSLASLGYDAEWHCISAAHVGAPHRRDRLWIIAYPNVGELRAPGTHKAEGWPASLLKHGACRDAWVEGWRAIVADVDSAVYGLPGVVDRLRPFGNTVVPPIPELIGRAILAADNVRAA